jgi:hypothetical protein
MTCSVAIRRAIHIRSACNPRCRGCWFFTYEYEKRATDQTDLEALKAFIDRECSRHVNTAVLIGGRSLVPDWVAAFVERMDYITVSANATAVRPWFRRPARADRPVRRARRLCRLRV